MNEENDPKARGTEAVTETGASEVEAPGPAGAAASAGVASASASASRKGKPKTNGAIFVGLGILLSRLAGLARERVFAHYFGNSASGDAFKAALRIPNFLQNLFAEGVLSASFIPVYANLLARKSGEEADKVAGAVASLLALVVSFFVVIGVIFTSTFIDLIVPGFEGEKRQLTIQLVQILFPGVGLLVMSAWCLGILNSHRRFFLSYFAPVVWNLSIISALVYFGRSQSQPQLAVTAAWGLVAGSALQFLIQLPVVFRLIGRLRLNLDLRFSPVRQVLRSFAPAVLSRGVVQISAYIDSIYASWLPTGAVAAIAYSQTIYLLPVSLFGMSVSAAELPEMASVEGSRAEVASVISERINRALLQVAFFIIPTLCAFIFLGDLVVGAIFQTGEFDFKDTLLVWAILAAWSIALLPATQGRLYSSAFYALRDADRPLKFAMIRVALTCFLGYFAALRLPGWLDVDEIWGAVFLSGSSAVVGWLEFSLLKSALHRKIGHGTGVSARMYLRLWTSAVVAVGIGYFLKQYLPPLHVSVRAAIVLGLVGALYVGFCYALGILPARRLVARVLRR